MIKVLRKMTHYFEEGKLKNKLLIRSILYLATALFSSLGIALVKLSLSNASISLSSFQDLLNTTNFQPWIFVSGLSVYIMSLLLGLLLLWAYPISIAYPIVVGLSLVILNVLSIIMLNETMGLYKIIGTILVILGIYFIQRSPTHPHKM